MHARLQRGKGTLLAPAAQSTGHILTRVPLSCSMLRPSIPSAVHFNQRPPTTIPARQPSSKLRAERGRPNLPTHIAFLLLISTNNSDSLDSTHCYIAMAGLAATPSIGVIGFLHL